MKHFTQYRIERAPRSLSASTLCRMRKCLRNNGESALHKLLSSSSTRPGVKTVLTSEEEDMIAERLISPLIGGLPLERTLKVHHGSDSIGRKTELETRVPGY